MKIVVLEPGDLFTDRDGRPFIAGEPFESSPDDPGRAAKCLNRNLEVDYAIPAAVEQRYAECAGPEDNSVLDAQDSRGVTLAR
jgi:hypothetical protein